MTDFFAFRAVKSNTGDPPERWVVCDVCDGEGEVWRGKWSHSVDSATIDPPWEIMERCDKCGGAGGWIDEVEPDEPVQAPHDFVICDVDGKPCFWPQCRMRGRGCQRKPDD